MISKINKRQTKPQLTLLGERIGSTAQKDSMLIKKATPEDLKYIISLANKEGKAVGFIPKVAYESAITGKKPSIHRWSDTCNDRIWLCWENGDPVGFIMMSYGRIAKCNQIAIQEDARLLLRGKALLEEAIKRGESMGIYNFGCGCANDLESNIFWKAMGWAQTGQRKGIHFSNTWKESSDRLINIYRYQTNSLFDWSKINDNETDGKIIIVP